jgi:hypothetical protein
MEEEEKKKARRSKKELTLTERLCVKFPEKDVKTRLLNSGTSSEKVIEYISGDKVIERLNECFGLKWSFMVTDKIVDVPLGQIAIGGRLSLQIDEEHVFKEQWGSSAIETYPNGQIISLGDNIKAATTDALKKCATHFGIGLYLYDNDEVKLVNKGYMAPATEEKKDEVEKLRELIHTELPCTKAQISTIIKIIKENELDIEKVKERYKVTELKDIKKDAASEFIIKWKELFIVNEDSNSDPEIITVEQGEKNGEQSN